jgi:hypothetical protein
MDKITWKKGDRVSNQRMRQIDGPSNSASDAIFRLLADGSCWNHYGRDWVCTKASDRRNSASA